MNDQTTTQSSKPGQRHDATVETEASSGGVMGCYDRQAVCRVHMLPSRSLVALVAATALLGPSRVVGEAPAAQATTDPASLLQLVIVTAPRRPDPGEIAGEIVPHFIQSHGKPATLTGQLGRWRVPPCAEVQGLSPAFNTWVAARVQAVAAIVGAPGAKAGACQRNVLIIFTTEPQTLMDNVLAHDSELLGFHYPHQAKKLAAADRPIKAWYVTATRGANGEEYVDDIFGTPPPGRPGSRLKTYVSASIVFVLVVVDTTKVIGRQLGAISDYVAVLALAQPASLDRCSDLPSIINLLASACRADPPPESLTAGDAAYLRALYAVDLEQPLSLQRSAIRTHMMREFTGHP